MEKVKKYLLENLNELKEVVREINSWNGSLEYLEAFENNEEFFNTFFYNNPMEAVRVAVYGKYNYMDQYVRFDGYGNLESLNEEEYIEKLKYNIDEILDELERNYENLNLNEELKKLLSYYLD